MGDEKVTTYADAGWWWNRLGDTLHDEHTALRFSTRDEAVRVGRLMALRRGLRHVVQHA